MDNSGFVNKGKNKMVNNIKNKNSFTYSSLTMKMKRGLKK